MIYKNYHNQRIFINLWDVKTIKENTPCIEISWLSDHEPHEYKIIGEDLDKLFDDIGKIRSIACLNIPDQFI